jgi:hypothetical protein
MDTRSAAERFDVPRFARATRSARYAACIRPKRARTGGRAVAEQRDELTPERPIRRFDVFAEYRKQEEEAKGRPEDEAMGYGLWVAKVVAARRFGGAKPKATGTRGTEGDGKRRDEDDGKERLIDGKWHALEGEPQTDALFEKEIVERMGRAFYHRVFAPAIKDARESGKSYESIRDAIRKGWKPA